MVNKKREKTSTPQNVKENNKEGSNLLLLGSLIFERDVAFAEKRRRNKRTPREPTPLPQGYGRLFTEFCGKKPLTS